VEPLDAKNFFENYLAGPLVIALYITWKVYSYFTEDPRVERRGWKFLKTINEINILSDIRDSALDKDLEPRKVYKTWMEWLRAAPMRIVHSLI